MMRLLLLILCTITFSSAGALAESTKMASTIVAGHTRGLISVRSTIRVIFAQEMVAPDALEQPLEPSPLVFEPPIAGEARWADQRTLEFRPVAHLPRGQHYKALVNLDRLAVTAAPPGALFDFPFTFTTLKQAFTIQVDGFSTPNQKKTHVLRLAGSITTADWEGPDKIMNLLTARQAQKGLNIKWTHNDDGREHRFAIDGIQRLETPSQVVLQWDDRAMGTARQGRRSVDVPEMGPFTATSARAVSGDTQYIEVRFSDPLDPKQDLKGLLRIQGQEDLRWEIDGSLVRIFSSRRWDQGVALEVAAGVRNHLGRRLGEARRFALNFAPIGPQVRFVGKGAIWPTTTGLTLPIEAVNLRKVMVAAIRIQEQNLPQFLQVNPLDGKSEIHRVGRTVWKKIVTLDYQAEDRNRWRRFGLDVSELTRNHPKGLYIIRLSFGRAHILYPCVPADPQGEVAEEEPSGGGDLDEEADPSYWDSYTQEQEYNWHQYYAQRKNPCHRAYYMDWHDHKMAASRNVIISDIGLMAKQGAGNKVLVAATDLKTAGPLAQAEIELLDYQLGVIATARTDDAGMALVEAQRKPFLVVARHDQMQGYLKIDGGSALSVSHFDVSGQAVTGGLKGFLYGERGVWRPGDPIYLTFILLQSGQTLPADHPVIFELRNPRGQLVKKIVKKESLNGFYTFQTRTAAKAPTGNWTATVRAGGALFEKRLKIETVRPNRLKIALTMEGQPEILTQGDLRGKIAARWLHGAVVRDLETDLAVTFGPRPTRFAKHAEYVFDDPVRKYRPEREELFQGQLDEKGEARFEARITAENLSPGMLTASFTTRVFEAGGGFSIDRQRFAYHPYERYAGIRVPKGDKARGMLLTDTDHTVRLALLDRQGKPIPKAEVEVSLYKIKWRWWWEKEAESIADYIGKESYRAIKQERVQIVNGSGRWRLRINYPAWGRYLIRVKDKGGRHVTGKIVYLDWPGWAGRAQKDIPGGASVLTLTADKERYAVGETATITIPASRKGRVLVSLENGSRIIATKWLVATGSPIRYRFEVTPEMAPNIYVHVTHLQPHLAAVNDLPIRMYGIVPIQVEDPKTLLKPEIDVPPYFRPLEKARIKITEAHGRAMTYTVAVVDEGLLDLTRFTTPDPRGHFYRREALGVKTWDLFDKVAGAYGGVLEQLLAIGGDGSGQGAKGRKANRFPPMVRFLGPFFLDAKQTATHELDIPQYIGSVRVMVVAGQERAFGSIQQAVAVKKPLMVLAALPRVLGPEETVDLPVTVFAMEETVKQVSVRLKSEGPVTIAGAAQQSIAFSQPGDDILLFKLRAQPQTGLVRLAIEAASGKETATHTLEIDLRHPGTDIVAVFDAILEGGERWETDVALPGIPGTNRATLEVSRIPPLNLAKRLDFLIRYPHGCVEQTTSAAFPQLYLNRLMDLPEDQGKRSEANIRTAIERLGGFQTTGGGFGYWPDDDQAHNWSSNYAGHFLVEAQRAGYLLPPEMLTRWKGFQRRQARRWNGGEDHGAILTQAYRLFTLALAGSCELGAMNRLRESGNLPNVARLRLAAAYQLCGQKEAGQALARHKDLSVPDYRELANTFGSRLRDKAMVVEALTILQQPKRAYPLVAELSKALCSEKWLSTQTIAYALVAMAGHAGVAGGEGEMRFEWQWRGKGATARAPKALIQMPLEIDAALHGGSPPLPLVFDNQGKTMLYPRVVVHGVPAPGTEQAAQNGLALTAEYLTRDGEPVDPDRIEQGSDLLVRISVRNSGSSGPYQEVALSHRVPSGWEIENRRLADQSPQGPPWDYQDIRDDRVYTYFDLAEGETKVFTLALNAAYIGRYYLPMISAEAMYDATINGRIPGHWIEVVKPGG